MIKCSVGVNRRPAKTYILNLYCECGGTIEAVKPIEIKDKLTAHKCNCCGKKYMLMEYIFARHLFLTKAQKIMDRLWHMRMINK